MVRPGRDRLSGRVEVDETYWGSEEENVRGRQTGNKALIVIAAQEDRDGVGRIRMRRIPDASAESLMPFTSLLGVVPTRVGVNRRNKNGGRRARVVPTRVGVNRL